MIAFRGALRFEQCIECAANTYAVNNSKCLPCAKGTFSKKGATSCLPPCKPGWQLDNYSPCEKCEPAFYSADGVRCKFCPSGTGSHRGAKRCFECPPGSFRDTRHVSTGRLSYKGCIPCPFNSFSDKYGAVQCRMCPPGTMTSDRGSTKCTPCKAGQFRFKLVSRKCSSCPEDTTSKGIAPAGCKHPTKGCPVDTFEDMFGECRACMPGERFSAYTKTCKPCRKNQISGGGASQTCKTCPYGKHPATDASVFEKSLCECDDGSIPNGGSDGGCLACPKGTHFDNRPAGAIWYTLRRQSYYRKAHCSNCEAGFYQDKEGSKECLMCPENSYSIYPGAVSCRKCPKGHISRPYDALDLLQRIITRNNCVNLRSGCEIGEVFNVELGNCEKKTCAPGEDFIEGRCGTCFFDHKIYNPTIDDCEECEPNAIPVGRPRRCKKCPKHAGDAHFDVPRTCICKGYYENYGNGCRRCPNGERSVLGKCAACPSDSVLITDTEKPHCERCTGEFYKKNLNDNNCSKCPKGTEKRKSVLGVELNECVPKDGYPAEVSF